MPNVVGSPEAEKGCRLTEKLTSMVILLGAGSLVAIRVMSSETKGDCDSS